MTITATTIMYGPTCNAETSELIGTQFGYWNKLLREIDQCVHTGGGTMQEYRTFLNTETGKVFKMIENGISYRKVLSFESVDEYRAYDLSRRQMERDPETGRLFSEYGWSRG